VRPLIWILVVCLKSAIFLENRSCVTVVKFSWCALRLTQTVGLLGRVISPSQGLYLHNDQHKHRINVHTDIHASSGIRTHDPSVRASEDISCFRSRGHYDRLYQYAQSTLQPSSNGTSCTPYSILFHFVMKNATRRRAILDMKIILQKYKNLHPDIVQFIQGDRVHRSSKKRSYGDAGFKPRFRELWLFFSIPQDKFRRSASMEATTASIYSFQLTVHHSSNLSYIVNHNTHSHNNSTRSDTNTPPKEMSYIVGNARCWQSAGTSILWTLQDSY
jgi:hypothetical protein